MGQGGDSGGGGAAIPRGRHPLAGLFTKEDHGHVHKMLGVTCLLHFVGRFGWCGTADMRFGPTRQTLAAIALHAILSASSLIFRIPIKRIAEGSRIWPEYRLHSITFAYRSLLCMLVTWCELQAATPQPPRYEWNAAIVLLTLAAADFGTWWVGPAGRSSTIQELDAPAPMRFFFSVMQFHATTGCLVGVRRFSTQFVYVWIIQFTAFLMTLRRKNLAPHGPLVVGYGLMLTFGFCVSTYDHYTAGCWLMFNALANSAAVLRLYFRMNKYALWLSLAVFLHLFRARLVLREGDSTTRHLAVWTASVLAIVAIGVRKVRRDYREIGKGKAS